MSDFDKWWITERNLTPHDRYIMWSRQQAENERFKREAGNYKGSFEVMCEANERNDGDIKRLNALVLELQNALRARS